MRDYFMGEIGDSVAGVVNDCATQKEKFGK